MIGYRVLFYLPVVASFALGALYLYETAGNPVRKAAIVVVFLGAAYLQFGSPFVFQGLILQTMLAIALELRRLYWETPV